MAACGTRSGLDSRLAVGVLVPLGGAPGTHTHAVNLSAAFAAVSAPLPECGLDADGAAPPALLPPPPPPGQPALTDAVVPRAWSTEGQCEGMTRQSGGTERCRVHRNSPYAVAAP